MDISFRTETCILGALVIATLLSAQSSTPIQLPASGRGLQPGSVGTTQSTVNAGGQNSVNLIDSSVMNIDVADAVPGAAASLVIGWFVLIFFCAEATQPNRYANEL